MTAFKMVHASIKKKREKKLFCLKVPKRSEFEDN